MTIHTIFVCIKNTAETVFRFKKKGILAFATI